MERKIFIHIPKNGGMTIRQAPELEGIIILCGKTTHKSPEYTNGVLATMKKYKEHPGLEHARWRDLKPDLTKQYRSFAIVRNPWLKVVSRYMFKKAVSKTPIKQSFEEFLEERHTWGNVKYYWHRAVRGWYLQKDHVTSVDGVIQCDILRQEHFNEDVMKYFNLTKPLNPRNISNGTPDPSQGLVLNKKDYKDFYTEETKQIIAEWYKDDIDFFGFSFEGTATKNLWKKNQ